MSVNAEWDATRYHRVAQPHAAWGASVIDRLELRGDERVLDAGCGSGRVTAQLLERLPAGHVIALDNSHAMVDQARQTLAAFGPRVTFVEADLLQVDQALAGQTVDLIFSTAVFHWIRDHPRLFAALRHVVRDGGRMVAQCGGGDNLARFMAATDVIVARAPFAAELEGKALWRNFAWPEETEARLRDAGFSGAEAWLEPSPQTFASADALGDFARGVVLSAHLTALSPALRDDFATQVVDEIFSREGAYALDYVRLNIQATA